MNQVLGPEVPLDPLLARVHALFAERHRFAKDAVPRALQAFGQPWASAFRRTLQALFESEGALEAAVQGYAAFAFDALRRHKRFERELAYPAKTHAEASQEVYLNEPYMRGQYLPGLLLSHYLWPHHFRQLMFFERAFLEDLRIRSAGRFAEVGVGTGLYSRRVLEVIPEIRGTGYDLSPTSLAFTQAHLRAFGVEERYDIRLQDVVAIPIDPVEALVCVEVLEHLEDPLTFLRSLRAGLVPGGKAFITAALDAPHADHIYLYRTHDQVLAHLREAGFTLEQSFLGAAYKPLDAHLPVPLAAAFVVT